MNHVPHGLRPDAKVICPECEWTGYNRELLMAINPFDPDQTETIFGCPRCRSPVNALAACMGDPKCWKQATCGGPSGPNGEYLMTCFDHSWLKRPERADNGHPDTIVPAPAPHKRRPP